MFIRAQGGGASGERLLPALFPRKKLQRRKRKTPNARHAREPEVDEIRETRGVAPMKPRTLSCTVRPGEAKWEGKRKRETGSSDWARSTSYNKRETSLFIQEKSVSGDLLGRQIPRVHGGAKKEGEKETTRKPRGTGDEETATFSHVSSKSR